MAFALQCLQQRGLAFLLLFACVVLPGANARTERTADDKVIITGPASCETCNVFDGGRWCSRSMMCFMPNPSKHHYHDLHDSNRSNTIDEERRSVFRTVEEVCARSCGEACGTFADCYSTANKSCGDCVFAGGWWSAEMNLCFIGNRSSTQVAANCLLDDGRNTCARRDDDCPVCSRFNRPIRCSPQVAVVIIAGLFSALFSAALLWMCYQAQRRFHSSDASDDGADADKASASNNDSLRMSGSRTRRHRHRRDGSASSLRRRKHASSRSHSPQSQPNNSFSFIVPDARVGGINNSDVYPAPSDAPGSALVPQVSGRPRYAGSPRPAVAAAAPPRSTNFEPAQAAARGPYDAGTATRDELSAPHGASSVPSPSGRASISRDRDPSAGLASSAPSGPALPAECGEPVESPRTNSNSAGSQPSADTVPHRTRKQMLRGVAPDSH